MVKMPWFGVRGEWLWLVTWRCQCLLEEEPGGAGFGFDGPGLGKVCGVPAALPLA